jgi:hypothetical protein
VENDLSFYVPLQVDLNKSGDTPELRIAGYASTSDEDRQGESIIQKGLDISDFVNNGWFNYDHDNTKILGYPDKTKTHIDSHGFYVEGTLLPGIPLAKSIWETAVALKKSNADRHLGFSVEGKVLERGEDGSILKAKIYNVAITPNPVNTATSWDAIVKSFSGCECQGLTTGYSVNVGDENSGGVLKKEDLEGHFRNLAKVVGDTEDSEKEKDKFKKCLMQKSLTVNEAILYLQLTKGVSYSQANSIVFKYIKEGNADG